MPRIENNIANLARDRIEAEYAKNPDYTFTLDSFLDIAPDRERRQALSQAFYNHVRSDAKHLNSLQVVGKVTGSCHRLMAVYAVLSVPIARINEYAPKEPVRPKRAYTPRTPKSDEVLDAQYRRDGQPAPAYVLELQNILFGMLGANHG